MVQEKISMRKIREVLRLRHEFGYSHAKIAGIVQIGETTVGEYLLRAKAANIIWPLSDDMDDVTLNKLLYPIKAYSRSPKEEPDFCKIHKELKRKGVTLQILWEEYKQNTSNGYNYSRFCDLYKQWACSKNIWMPQVHKVGECIFVDYAGQTIPVYDAAKKTFYEAQIFVGTLGASSYIYAEATKSQKLEDWISSHCNMFEFFGGIPEIIVPDNLKSGVIKPHLYEPLCNQTYLEMAQHYGIAIMPARVRKPQDKSKVENGVQNVERQILAKIRNLHFFSIEEINQEISKHLKDLNNRPFQKLPGSRYSYFLELDKPALNSLPETRYELAFWMKQKVNGGYHVNVEGHNYSVPYIHVYQHVEIRYNQCFVEIFCKGKQITCHKRKFEQGAFSTNPNHQPKSHQVHSDCTPEKLIDWAAQIGPSCNQWVKIVLEDNSRHIEQRKRTALGTLRLSKSFEEERLEKACQRGLYFELFSFKSIQSILKNNLDFQILNPEKTPTLPQNHENIRGSDYYEQQQKGEKNVKTSCL